MPSTVSGTGGEFYKCEECGASFSSQEEIERHNLSAHIETAGQKE